MKYLLALSKEDGLNSDGERILGKNTLKEVETGSVVPDHTLISRQVHTKQTNVPTMWGSYIMLSLSQKYFTDLYNGLAPESLYL